MKRPLQNLIPSSPIATPFVAQKAIIHGGDYNPEQWLATAPSILEEDAELMRQTGINSVSVGIFSWGALEPTEGNFSFEWLDRVFDQQAGLGNRVILATPSGSMPAWLAEKYPDARRVDERGFRAHYGHRHNHCWSSPSYHDRVALINTKLAERYGHHPALALWHVSNELAGHCYCDLCRAAWTQWLEHRYGSLEAMNNAHWNAFWSHQATDWHHAEPTDEEVDGRRLDWLRFTNRQLIDWYTFEAETLRAISPKVPITTNFMTTTHGLNYHKIARGVDVIADDQYPSYDPDRPDFIESAAYWSLKQDLYRCMKPGRSFMLMESCPGAVQWRTPQKAKRPDVHRLEMLQAIAHGSDGTCYFQFRAGRGSMEKLHGAVVEHWGSARHTQTRRFRELRELSDTYAKLSPLLGTSVRPQVAIVYDWESRWAQQLSCGTGISSPHWQANQRHPFDTVATEQYQPFWSRGVPVDVIPNDRDTSGYKLVVLPMHWIMTPALSEKLRDFVHGGGTLVATWDTAMADENNRMLLGGWPGEGLGEVFGLWVESVDRLAPGTPRAIAGLPGAGGDVAAMIHLEGATSLATFAEDYYQGQPAVTQHTYGQGRAFFIGTRLSAEAREAFYNRLIAETGLEQIIDANLPAGVTAQLRGTGENVFVIFLNFSRNQQTVRLGTRRLKNIETDQIVKDTLVLDGLESSVFRLEM